VDACFLTKIQWLLFMKIHWRQLVNYLCVVPIIGYNVSRDLFLKLALHMSCIILFCRIMNPFMDCGGDKVMYMLCIFKCKLLGGWRRSMIKLSNVWPCVLKSTRQKVRAIDN
jgi:hypothetical protein